MLLASFPLSLVRESLSLRRQGRYNWDAFRKVGHKVVPVTCNDAPKYVHCGSEPLAFISNVFCDAGSYFKFVRTIYISNTGNLVFPG